MVTYAAPSDFSQVKIFFQNIQLQRTHDSAFEKDQWCEQRGSV